ncbi:nitrate reductase molybdenum cofactor assembly chaperone [Gordonia alkaliphila]|uniref:Nitrate reductase molybdenum cofactor assembly chaperone n=1 Tax=Gordonia alkaliphila TaxID=1053547 RepID=A0ABP8ZD63_9ACTN
MRNRLTATRRRVGRKRDDHRIVYQGASWCLSYPDDDLLGRLPMLAAALDEQPDSAAVRTLRGVVEHLAAADPATARQNYVDVFDMTRRHTLYLTYWTDGDTRRRGTSLGAFKQRYRDSGFLVDTHGELPDYLPMVLEFAARVDAEGGHTLLVENRPALELIRIALDERDSPYADVLAAVCATLPGASPAGKATALAMAAAGPAVEAVGLDSSGPAMSGPPPSGPGGRKLLPLYTSNDDSADRLGPIRW